MKCVNIKQYDKRYERIITLIQSDEHFWLILVDQQPNSAVTPVTVSTTQPIYHRFVVRARTSRTVGVVVVCHGLSVAVWRHISSSDDVTAVLSWRRRAVPAGRLETCRRIRSKLELMSTETGIIWTGNWSRSWPDVVCVTRWRRTVVERLAELQ